MSAAFHDSPPVPRRAPWGPAVAFCALVAVARLGYAIEDHPEQPSFVDFDIFRIAGRLAVEGHLAQAYDWTHLRTLEIALGGSPTGYGPFAYPPLFGLLMAGLSPLPTGLAYFAFVAVGLGLLVSAVRRLAPTLFWPCVAALLPALCINVAIGQNGMLTGGLAGLATSWAIGRRPGSAAGGLAGALAALKPQVAVCLPLLLVRQKRWRALGVMLATGLGLTGLAAACLGPEVVGAFLRGLAATGEALSSGRFPLFRMTSVYAAFRSFGLPSGLAIAIHAAVALAAIAAAASAGGMKPAGRAEAGLIVMSTAFVSPYLYDYDLTIAGLGLALVLESTGARRGPVALGLVAVAVAGSLGIAQTCFGGPHLSLGALPLLLAFAVAHRLVRDAPTAAAGPAGTRRARFRLP